MEENEYLVDLSLYKLFYLVCKNGSFTKTAKELDLTQPSVSYNIKKLEDGLGVTLFERGNNLIMTPEAEELLPYVEEALNNLKNGERKINDIVVNFLKNNPYNYSDLKNQIILELLPFINELTGRRPIILPVIMEVNKSED